MNYFFYFAKPLSMKPHIRLFISILYSINILYIIKFLIILSLTFSLEQNHHISQLWGPRYEPSRAWGYKDE